MAKNDINIVNSKGNKIGQITFWNNLEYSDKVVDQLIKCAEERPERAVVPSKKQKKDRCHEKNEYLRKRFGFTISKYKDSLKIWRAEEAIERVLIVKNEDLWNQFNLGDGGKENIDLVRADSDGKILEIYELKKESTGDAPIYALYEVLKNYQLIKKFPNIELQKPLELTILAPKEYFKHYQNSMDEFCKIVKKLNEIKKDEFNIKLKTLNLTSIDILEKIKKSCKYEAGTLTAEQVEELSGEISSFPFEIREL